MMYKIEIIRFKIEIFFAESHFESARALLKIAEEDWPTLGGNIRATDGEIITFFDGSVHSQTCTDCGYVGKHHVLADPDSNSNS